MNTVSRANRPMREMVDLTSACRLQRYIERHESLPDNAERSEIMETETGEQ